ncbi:hypothetical protein EDB86DRAFT_3083464 [Lactarius hatsudake]|nr:hypothetical protein EDB86DRAFT_3083464 [Lactarius hatsudake]
MTHQTLTFYALTPPPFHRHHPLPPATTQGVLRAPSHFSYLTTLYLLHLKLFISAFMLASNCDDTYLNKSWWIPSLIGSPFRHLATLPLASLDASNCDDTYSNKS